MKKLILISIVLILYGLFTSIYIHDRLEDEKEKSYIKLSHELKNELNNEKRFLKDRGTVNALFIAKDRDIQEALLKNNRNLAIKRLQKIEKDFKKRTNIEHIRVHIHTKETKSFVRSWELDTFGDDLSSFRKAIVKVKITHEPFFGFEVGKMGLTLRSIVPIIHKEKFIGSLEFIQNFDKTLTTFKKKQYRYLLLIKQSLVGIATDLKNAPNIGPYILSSRVYDKDFLQASQNIDFHTLKQNGYFISSQYFYTYEDIKDTKNSIAGLHLLAMPAKRLQKEIDTDKQQILNKLVTQTLFALLILVIISLLYLFISSNSNSK